MDEYILNEERRVKSQLVNNVMLVASIVGLPLLAVTYIRAFSIGNQPKFLLVIALETFFYLVVLLLYFFRKKIKYFIRAWFVISIAILLAVLDLWQVGFMSLGFIWLNTAVILSALFFNFKKGIYSTAFGLCIILIFFSLARLGILKYTIDYNKLAVLPVTPIIRMFMYLITSLIIIFAIKQIFDTLNNWNSKLQMQTANLLTSTQRLKHEIEVRKKSEQHALENEHKFKNIFELSTDPIVIIGFNGKVVDFNNSFLELTELAAESIKGIDYLNLMPEEHRDQFAKFKNSPDDIPVRFELKYKRNDGQLRYLDITTTAIAYSTQKAVLAVFRDNTEKINWERTIFSAALEAEEKERLRLSRELHDGLGPLLSTIKIYLEVLEKRPGDTEIQQRINSTLNESIKSVKEISNNLSPYILRNLGVVKALKSFIDKITFNQQFEVSFESNIENRLSEKIEIAIYRLITELLNNTIKHALATRVDIKINIEQQLLTVSYTDNGIGFDMETLRQKSNGIGLFNMKSRIEKLGGKININSSVGNGLKVFAQLNLNEIA